MDAIVAVAFVPMLGRDSPNVRPWVRSVPETYYRAAHASLASARRAGHDRLYFITPSAVPVTWQSKFDAETVEMRRVPFNHRPPDGFWHEFNASMYAIDAVQALATELRPDQTAVLIDPDCIVTRSLDGVVNAAAASGLAAYPLHRDDAPTHAGLSAKVCQELERALRPQTRPERATYYGGECYVFSRAGAADLLPLLEEAWEFSMERHTRGIPHFTVEEHLFNFAFHQLQVGDLSPFVRRIWTAPTKRDVKPTDLDLSIWHLPSEKDRGFRGASRLLSDPRARLSPKTLGRCFGIPRRGSKRLAYDLVASAGRRVQRSFG